MTSPLETRFFIPIRRMSKQMTFLESRNKTGQDRHVFHGKMWVSKFDLFNLNLTWPVVNFENECYHCIPYLKWPVNISHTTLLLHFIWRPHLTWPWLALNIILLRIWHLHNLFSSTLAESGLAAVSGLASAADMTERVSVSCFTRPWPDNWFLKKISRLH